MFYYPGSKHSLAKTYPKPDYPIVIEPFAGSMAYSLHYRPDVAIGVDADLRVTDLWARLRAMSRAEIEEHPALVAGRRTEDFWEITARRSLRVGTYTTINENHVERFERNRRRALANHDYARGHVIVLHGDYTSAPDIEATWFIDPPYQTVLRPIYRESAEYSQLAAWVKARRGQVIVSEGEDADWLAFGEHRLQRTINDTMRRELIWTANTSRTCQQCSKRFDGRSDARFCSTRCRVAAHRAENSPCAPRRATQTAKMT